jgi:hypothetical protein
MKTPMLRSIIAIVFLAPTAQAYIKASRICTVLARGDRPEPEYLAAKDPTDVQVDFVDRLQFEVMNHTLPGLKVLYEHMRDKLVDRARSWTKRSQSADFDGAARGKYGYKSKTSHSQCCQCSLCNGCAVISEPVNYEDAKSEKLDYCKDLKALNETLGSMEGDLVGKWKEKAQKHSQNVTGEQEEVGRKKVQNYLRKSVRFVTDEKLPDWKESVQEHINRRVALERLIRKPIALHPRDCCTFCNLYGDGEELAQAAYDAASVPSAALLGLLVGAGGAILALAVLGRLSLHRGSSTSSGVQEPLLGE